MMPQSMAADLLSNDTSLTYFDGVLAVSMAHTWINCRISGAVCIVSYFQIQRNKFIFTVLYSRRYDMQYRCISIN